MIDLADDAATLAWFRAGWDKVNAGEWTLDDLVRGWLAHAALWGRDLNDVPGLAAQLATDIGAIDGQGMRALLK